MTIISLKVTNLILIVIEHNIGLGECKDDGEDTGIGSISPRVGQSPHLIIHDVTCKDAGVTRFVIFLIAIAYLVAMSIIEIGNHVASETVTLVQTL